MGADVDLNNVDVVEELNNWGKWYLKFCDLDGFRLDAIKHMRESFSKTGLIICKTVPIKIYFCW